MPFDPTPFGTQYGTFQLKVAAYILATDADALAQAAFGIRDAVNELNMAKWKWNIAYQEHTLVAGTAEYEMEAPFKAPRKLALVLSSQPRGLLSFMEPHEFQSVYPDRSGNGVPECYTFENMNDIGKLILSSPPDSGFVSSYSHLRVWYYRRVQPQSASTDILNIPSEAESFVEWRAKEYIAANYDPSKIGVARTRADMLWQKLKRDDVLLETGDWVD